MKCRNCGRPLSRSAPICPSCGEPTRRRKGGCCGVIASAGMLLFLGLVAVVAISPKPSRPPAASAPTSATPAPAPAPASVMPGDSVQLVLPGGSGVFLARTDEAWNEMLDAENANSRELMGRLFSQQKVFRVPNGTPAIVVKTSVFSVFVQTTGEAFGGQEGWVQREFVTK